MFVLKQTVDYFVSRGSTVYMAAVGAQKAFDRVNHVKLFNILIRRKFTVNFVKIIVNWYTNIYSIFRWNGVMWDCVALCSGIRQGGILSPVLFNIYVDVASVYYSWMLCW